MAAVPSATVTQAVQDSWWVGLGTQRAVGVWVFVWQCLVSRFRGDSGRLCEEDSPRDSWESEG
jgi:hypothetical protein